jgi:hypothetical protein
VQTTTSLIPWQPRVNAQLRSSDSTHFSRSSPGAREPATNGSPKFWRERAILSADLVPVAQIRPLAFAEMSGMNGHPTPSKTLPELPDRTSGAFETRITTGVQNQQPRFGARAHPFAEHRVDPLEQVPKPAPRVRSVSEYAPLTGPIVTSPKNERSD